MFAMYSIRALSEFIKILWAILASFVVTALFPVEFREVSRAAGTRVLPQWNGFDTGVSASGTSVVLWVSLR